MQSPEPTPTIFGISLDKPKFPGFAAVSQRLKSFETWPDYLPLKKDVLVEAGLVYTGVGDSCRCFFCGGGLRNWEYDDVPMEEHAKWYPKCTFILLVKGQAYIDKLGRGERPDDENKCKVAAKTDPLSTAAAQSCIENGFSEESVKKAIDYFIQNHDYNDFKATDLCKILFDFEENSTDLQLSSISTQEVDTSDSECSSDGEIEPIELLLEENRRLKEVQTCKICFDNPGHIVFLPCGHMVSCAQCAPALSVCPMCRKGIKGYVKAYYG